MSTRCARELPPWPCATATTCPDPASTRSMHAPPPASGCAAAQWSHSRADARLAQRAGAESRGHPSQPHRRTLGVPGRHAPDRVRRRRERRGCRGPAGGDATDVERDHLAEGVVCNLCAVCGEGSIAHGERTHEWVWRCEGAAGMCGVAPWPRAVVCVHAHHAIMQRVRHAAHPSTCACVRCEGTARGSASTRVRWEGAPRACHARGIGYMSRAPPPQPPRGPTFVATESPSFLAKLSGEPP